MKNTRKILCLLLAAMLACGLFAGCSGGFSESSASADSGRLKIVTTIFPAWDWVRQIVGDGDNVDLILLGGAGTDLHSFSPSTRDILDIADCDLFLYVGGESDAWASDALSQNPNGNRTALSLLELVGDSAREEELAEGMEADDEEEEEAAYDEHVWLSPKNAALCCEAISAALQELDPGNRAAYLANKAAYVAKLQALDENCREAVNQGRVKTLLFGDRFPFLYLVKDYGLDYYAAFPGCSAETEASFATILFLAQKTDELGLPAILQIETSDGAIARTIRDNTASKNQEILVLDSMQGITRDDIENGTSYLSIMEENLAVLKEALG